MKTLLFFTQQFPFGAGETFIESEFPFLHKAFDRIIIVSNDVTAAKTRTVPDNVELIRFQYAASARYKAIALLHLPRKMMREEWSFIGDRYQNKFDQKLLTVLLSSYAKILETNAFIEELVAKEKLDINELYIYSYWMSDMAAGAALFKTSHPQAKIFCRAHRWDIYFEYHQPPYLPFRNFILENIDACYCIAEDGVTYLNALTGDRYTDKLKLSRLGTFNQKEIRSGSNTGKLKLVSCSNIIPVKRVNLIVEALALVKDVPVEWVHFGDGVLRKEVEELAKEKLSNNPGITFEFKGSVKNTEVLAYYEREKVDLFINVSISEGIPVSIMEANSYGIPAMVTNVGGSAELIQDGFNGALLPQEVSPHEIVAAIEKFYKLPAEKKEEMRTNAFRNWDKKYKADRNYADFIKAITG